MDERKQATVDRFTEAVEKCQAVSYVAIIKDGDKSANFVTGGYKGEGPTIIDMARGMGAMAAELASVIETQATAMGSPTTFDAALGAVIQAMLLSAKSACIKGGTTTIQDA